MHKQIYLILKNLDRSCFEPIVISQSQYGGYRQLFLNLNCKSYSLGWKNRFSFLFILSRFIKILHAEKPDIIFITQVPNFIYFRLARFFLPFKIIQIGSFRAMNFWLGHKSKFYSIIERFLVRYFYETSDYLTANSKALVEFYSNQILNYSKNIRLIYNGIDFNFDIEQIMKEKDDLLNENNPIVVSVARFDSMKDFDTLLRAASIVISKRNDVKFLLVGDGELKTSILEQIESLNLKNNVFVIGEVANVYGYVNLANVFVLSTTGEGLSNAVLEAMLMAKPVIATSVGGNTELLENMRGVLVSPRNPIELASRIINIINDKGKGEEIGKNAQKYVIDNFSIDRMVNSYEQLFSIAYNKLSMGILNK